MPRVERVRLQRVEFVPRDLEEGILYASDKYRTAVHLCCCGCGSKVVTPLKPYAWALTTKGDAASLRPSIGNWSLPCKSHYWILNGRVEWAEAFTGGEIRLAQSSDWQAQEQHFHPGRPKGLWARFVRWVKSLR